MRYLFTFSLGVFSVAWWPQLPQLWLYVVGLLLSTLISVLLRMLGRGHKVIAASGLIVVYFWGAGWGLVAAYQTLSHQLPQALDRENLLVTGTIVGLVDSNDRRSKFHFRVDSAFSQGKAVREEKARSANFDNIKIAADYQRPVSLNLLQLSSYSQQTTDQLFRPGDQWQLQVRLRRPRGFLNPGGFDYQRWLIQTGVSATGYVVESEFNKPLESPEVNPWGLLHGQLSRWRNGIAQAIEGVELSSHGAAVLAALTLGDRHGVADLWADLTRLGIVHLMIVSGLHVGLVAGFGFILGRLVLSLIQLCNRLYNAPINRLTGFIWLPPLAGLLAAASYSLLAGFSLPAQRALIAVAVVMLAKLSLRKIRPLTCLVWGLLLIAVSQPLAILSSGFWLSFMAVAILLAWFYPWQSTQTGFSLFPLVGAQLALTAGLLVPSLVLVGAASYLGPLVNLLAVPWVSLVTVPLALLGCLGLLFSSQVAEMLWRWADYSINGLWYLLDLIPAPLGLVALPVALSWPLASCALVAALCWLLPSGLAVRLLGCLPLMAYLLAPREDSILRLTVLDVGQGLAVVLETSDKMLVYDAGPAYGEAFNAGAGIIAPYLRSRGRQQIDQLIISHEDLDHAGGLPGLLSAMQVGTLMHGPGLPKIVQGSQLPANSEICTAGQHWSWPLDDLDSDGEQVHFQVLAPDSTKSLPAFVGGNNYSCVLLITWRDQSILLPGDIERQVEGELQRAGRLAKVDILLAPHHGSKTSSTAAFAALLAPRHVVFSAGYRHHFGHPHAEVQQRYAELGSLLWNTGHQGALRFVWSKSGALSVEAARLHGPRFWWRPASVDPSGIMLGFRPVDKD